jgi:hypothetical protein
MTYLLLLTLFRLNKIRTQYDIGIEALSLAFVDNSYPYLV